MPIQGTTSASFILGARTTPQSDTVILLPFNGDFGDTTTSDLAQPAKVVTFYGNAALDTNAKFGSTALRLTGGTDRVEVLTSEKTYTAFTLEAWVNYANFTTYAPILSLGIDEDNVLEFATDGQRIRTRIVQNGVDVFNVVTSITAIFKNVWRHYALICDGTDMRFMIDGVAYTRYPGVTFPFPASKLTVGNFLNGVNNIGSIDGFIDDVRFSKSVRYGDPYDVPLISVIFTDNQPFTIRNVSGNINAFSTTTVIINGANFTPDITIVRFISRATGLTLTTSGTVTYISPQQITATTETSVTSIPADTIVDIQLESSLTYRQATFTSAFVVSNSPIWITPTGQIGFITNTTRTVNTTLVSTIPDASPIVYTLLSGSLPPGLFLTGSTGVISGIASEGINTATYTFTVRATANADNSRISDRTFTFVQISFLPSWVTTAGSLGTFTDASRNISIPVSATVVDGTLSYSVVAGALPAGLTIGAATGIISGTAIAVATQTTSSFTLRTSANNDAYRIADRNFTITLDAAIISWTTSTLPTVIVNSPYSTTVVATPSSGSVSYNVVAGSLPTGLSLNSSNGAITGTTTVAIGDYPVTIRATTTSANVSADRTFTVTVSSLTLTASAPVVDQGTTVTMSIGAPGLPDSTVVAYTITGVASSDINNESLTGTATVSSGAASFTINTTDFSPIGSSAKTATVSLDGRGVSTSFVIFKPVVTSTVNTDGTVNFAWTYYTTGAGIPDGFDVFLDGSLVSSPSSASINNVTVNSGANRTLLIRPVKGGVYTNANIIKTIRMFTSTGAQQTFSVPSLKRFAMVDVIGAQGGSSGGYGGRTRTFITTTPGETLNIFVGGQGVDGYRANCSTFNPGAAAGGFNGGGNGGYVTDSYGCGSGTSYAFGPGGGGASDIRQGGTALANRIIVSGGGGGGAYPNASCASGGNVVGFGAGYNTNAQEGGVSGQSACGGGWPFGAQGRAATGGSGGSGGSGSVASGTAGSLGQGGTGGQGGVFGDNPGYPGGGGGGFYGGGGAGSNSNFGSGGSGGGGSGYLDSGLTTLYSSYGASNAGYNTGGGRILVII